MWVDTHATDGIAHGPVGEGDATDRAVIVAGMVVMMMVMLVGSHDVQRCALQFADIGKASSHWKVKRSFQQSFRLTFRLLEAAAS
jgi:hypothetical protein